MGLFPPVINKLSLTNLGKELRGVRLMERGLGGYGASHVWDTSPNDSLWAYYAFEDGTDNNFYADSSGNGRHLETSYSLTGHLTSSAGKNNNCITPSAGDEADAGAKMIQSGADNDEWDFDGQLGCPTSFTIRLWFKITTVAGLPPEGSLVPLLNKRLAKGWGLYVDHSYLCFNVFKDNDPDEHSVIEIDNAGIVLDDWNYVVAYHSFGSPGEIGLKLNGASFVTTAHSGGITGEDETVKIGSLFSDVTMTPGHPFSIDELAVWSRVLSANDITHDYNAGNGKFWPSLT